MCTVTFIPSNNKYYITSSRDEKHARKQAMPPQEYVHNNVKLVYPKDADAAGTWIAMKDNGDAAVLLNGAFKKHVAAPPYAKSRGLILLDIFEADDPITKFTKISLGNIEPFTLLLSIENELYECRWDGDKKYGRQLLTYVPHIWSSVTLYNDEAVMKREGWFEEWLNTHAAPGQDDIFNFHQFAGDGDTHNDLQMSRDNIYGTVSITSIELGRQKNIMRYLDLKNNLAVTKQIAVGHYTVA